MKVLIVNKFLYYNGGSETYIFELAKELEKLGHEVQFFGMEHPDRVAGNKVGAYTSNMDFHGGRLSKLLYPFKIIYSREARKKIRLVLDDMRPDVVHLNNINFQLTPSIILEIKKWAKDTGANCRIVATIHDPQWVCPNHMLINGRTGKGCTECLGGRYMACTKYRCIHGSLVKSFIGTVEASIYRRNRVYRNVDVILCPSHFMKRTMDHNPDLKGRTVMFRNFLTVSRPNAKEVEEYKRSIGLAEDERYVPYLGRYSEEKGIHTLVKAAKALPDIRFIFAGSGPFEDEVNSVSNIKNMGFVAEKERDMLLSAAEFSLIASECYENCPFTVMESLTLGTPVIGADIGGIPELIEKGKTGELYESGNPEELAKTIKALWDDKDKIASYRKNCAEVGYMDLEEYTKEIVDKHYVNRQ